MLETAASGASPPRLGYDPVDIPFQVSEIDIRLLRVLRPTSFF